VKQFSKFVGMDVHKATIAVSVADAGRGEVRYIGEIANTPVNFKLDVASANKFRRLFAPVGGRV
jgi:hypothetical protein